MQSSPFDRDEDTLEPGPARARPATAATLDGPGGEPTIVDPAENNVVFTSLVTGDQDIVGLVAYSIYKQNKYDWLLAFSRTMERMPDEIEARSYLLGESTPRRLATYRHLAEATLEGRGLEVPGVATGVGPTRNYPLGRRSETAAKVSGWHPSRPLLAGIVVAVLVVLALFWLFHSGAVTPTKP